MGTWQPRSGGVSFDDAKQNVEAACTKLQASTALLAQAVGMCDQKADVVLSKIPKVTAYCCKAPAPGAAVTPALVPTPDQARVFNK